MADQPTTQDQPTTPGRMARLCAQFRPAPKPPARPTVRPDHQPAAAPTVPDWSGLLGRLQRLREVSDRALQLAADYRPEPTRRRRSWQIAQRVDEAYAYVVLLAPLAVAGWLQAHAVHTRLDLPWPLAVGFTVAWEGAAAYCARLFVRALLRRDSTLVLRIGMYAYAAISCGLLWWNLHVEGKQWYLAAAVGALTASGIFLWTRRARDLHRDALHAQGLVDAQVVRFSVWSWLAAPIETPRAFRYAIKHRISHPGEAIETYRAYREQQRVSRQLRADQADELRHQRALELAASRTDHPTTPELPQPDPTIRPAADHPTTAVPSDQQPTRAKPEPTTRRAKPTRTKKRPQPTSGLPRSTADQKVLDTLDGTYRGKPGYPTTAPTLSQIQTVAGGSRDRAIRIRRLLVSDHGKPEQPTSDDKERVL